MRGSIAAELFVLRKRTSTWILLGLWGLLATLFSYVLPYAGEVTRTSLAQLLPQGLVGNLAGSFPFFGGVFALMLGVLSVGSEYGWGTLRTLFVQRPGRLRMLAAKLAALALGLVPFVLLVFIAGAASSNVIAQLEDAAVTWPSPWLLIRALGAGWLILAVWAALGVLLAVVSRGTALAIGIGILYALVIEGLLSAFADGVSVLGAIVDFFLRTNGYSLVRALGTPAEAIADNGPGSFSGPYVGTGEALLVLAAYMVVALVLSAALLRRRDVA